MIDELQKIRERQEAALELAPDRTLMRRRLVRDAVNMLLVTDLTALLDIVEEAKRLRDENLTTEFEMLNPLPLWALIDKLCGPYEDDTRKCRECGKDIGPRDDFIVLRVWSLTQPTLVDAIICSEKCKKAYQATCKGG